MTTLQQLRDALDQASDDAGRAWLTDALAAVAADPTAIRGRFPAAGRKVGRGTLPGHAHDDDLFAWHLDDAARTLLIAALGDALGDELAALYRHGDAAERRGVLRALEVVEVGDLGEAIVADALRTNDLRLIAAAMSPYALERMDDEWVSQAVLKCVFVGIPLQPIRGLDRRVTPELSRMLAGFAHERVAAGRQVPADIWPLVDRFPPSDELAAIEAELDHAVAERREAAAAALEDRRRARAGTIS